MTSTQAKDKYYCRRHGRGYATFTRGLDGWAVQCSARVDEAGTECSVGKVGYDLVTDSKSSEEVSA